VKVAKVRKLSINNWIKYGLFRVYWKISIGWAKFALHSKYFLVINLILNSSTVGLLISYGIIGKNGV
jgi:hypothetical protein